MRIVGSMERSKIITDAPTYVHAESRIQGIGYVDDVELYFDQEAQVILD